MARVSGIGEAYSRLEIIEREDAPGIIVWKRTDSIIEADGEWEAGWEEDPLDPDDPFGDEDSGGGLGPTGAGGGGGAVGSSSSSGHSEYPRQGTPSSSGRGIFRLGGRRGTARRARQLTQRIRIRIREKTEEFKQALERIKLKIQLEMELRDIGISSFDTQFVEWLMAQAEWSEDFADFLETMINKDFPDNMIEHLMYLFIAARASQYGYKSWDEILDEFREAFQKYMVDQYDPLAFERWLKWIIRGDAVRSKYDYFPGGKRRF